MQQAYRNCINSLKNFKETLIDENDVKKGNLYFSWIANKTDKIQYEKDVRYLFDNLVNNTFKNYDINTYIYHKLNENLKKIIKNNYFFDGKKYKFFNRKISFEETMLLAKHIIFRRGNVVWIDFGFNIGNEFGGMHPAVILKNFDSELFVLPVSSKKPTEYKKIEEAYNANSITFEEYQKRKDDLTEIIQLDKIFGFKNLTRFGNITRMRKVSILRLNFSGSIGSISGRDLNLISQKIKQEF